MIQNLYLKKLEPKEKDEHEDEIPKPISTSATIKTTNYKKLNEKSIVINIPKYQIAILCMELFIKNRHSLLEKKFGTVKYNEPSEYSTLGLIYENKDKYELFRSIRTINQYSVSFLMDIAIEMYLDIVINKILNKIDNLINKFNFANIFDTIILSIKPIESYFKINIQSNHFVSYFYNFLVK